MEEGSLSAFDCGLGRAQEETAREMADGMERIGYKWA